MDYALGVTLGNLQDITTLELPEVLYPPLSDFVPFSATRQRMDGILKSTGRPVITWHFPELTLGQMGTLLYFLTDPATSALEASRIVWVRTRITQGQMGDRVFANFQAIMRMPVEADDAKYGTHRKYNDVEIKFINAVSA